MIDRLLACPNYWLAANSLEQQFHVACTDCLAAQDCSFEALPADTVEGRLQMLAVMKRME